MSEPKSPGDGPQRNVRTSLRFPWVTVDVDAVRAALGGEVLTRGSDKAVAVGAANLDAADCAGALSFCNSKAPQAFEDVRSCGAAILIASPEIVRAIDAPREGQCLIGHDDPRLAFIMVLDRALGMAAKPARIAASAYVDPGATVGASVTIGEGVVVGAGCRIGDFSVIGPRSVLVDDVELGQHVVVQAGAVIGADGFGFQRDAAAGRLHRFPHGGGVRIGDKAEIGANATIDRGALSDTVIGQGTKIDNLAYVAHNVTIGRDCLIMAGAVISGSVTVGDGVEISPGAVLRDKISIGSGARIGLGAVVTANVPEGTLVAGVPARPW